MVVISIGTALFLCAARGVADRGPGTGDKPAAARPASQDGGEAKPASVEERAAQAQRVAKEPVPPDVSIMEIDEAKLSSRLRELRKSFRYACLIDDERTRFERMLEIADQIDAGLRSAPKQETPWWLLLREQVLIKAGDVDGAVRTLQRRFEWLARSYNADRVVDQALREGLRATALEQYELAEACYATAERLPVAHRKKFAVIKAYGRMISKKDGMDAAVSYFHAELDRSHRDAPVLSHNIHFLVAQEYYRNGDTNGAITELGLIVMLYDDPEVEMLAEGFRQRWVMDLDLELAEQDWLQSMEQYGYEVEGELEVWTRR